MNRHGSYRLKKKLLIGGTVCVAAVVAMVILRGGRGTSPVISDIPQRTSTVSEMTVGETTLRESNSPNDPRNAAPPSASIVNLKYAAEVAKIFGLTDLNERAVQLQKLAESVPPMDIPILLEALRTTAPGFLDSELRLPLVTRWTQIDAVTASAWVEHKLHDLARPQALNAVARAWVATDQNAAVAWARQLSEPNERGGVLTSLAYEIGHKDVALAAQLTDEINHGEARDVLALHLATLWTETSPAKALEWVATLPEDDLREQLISAVATAWAEKDPIAAGTLAVQSLSAGKGQEDAVVAIVQRWTQQEPAKAAAWVMNFPAGHLRDTAVEELVKLWTGQDIEQAGKWLSALEAGRNRDIAAGAYAGSIAPAFPKIAADWAVNIGDDALRESEVKRVMEIWLSNDARAAQDWLAATQLPESQKSGLLNLKRE